MTIKRIFIILISLLFANSVLADAPLKILLKSFKGGELVKIPSYNSGPFPNEFMSIKDGSYKNSPVEIDALIAYPKKGEGPFPVLVFNHASGGPKSYISKWFKFNKSMAMQLRKKGIAVMFVDNFTTRNVTGAAADQAQVSTYSFYIDAFMTLEYLSKDPKINIKKVGITGWSRGGMNSLAISEKRIRDAKEKAMEDLDMVYQSHQLVKHALSRFILELKMINLGEHLKLILMNLLKIKLQIYQKLKKLKYCLIIYRIVGIKIFQMKYLEQ